VNGHQLSAASKYQQSQVTHADPVGLILMLYDGAIARIAQGRERFREQDFLQAGLAVTKAQAIVAELGRSLNMEEGGSIAGNLDRLYAYLHRLLVRAAIENRTEPLDEAVKVLSELRGAWSEVAKQSPTPAGSPNSVITSGARASCIQVKV
jgi:flagellar secretion chaperone FliS